MGWEYKVVPFEAKKKAGEKISFQQAAADQFEALLKTMNDAGYEYYRMDNYNVRQSPGCMMLLRGHKEILVTYNVAVFRRPV